MGGAEKVRVQQEKLVDQRKLLTNSLETMVGMNKSELTRAPSAARVNHEEKLIEGPMESYYLFICTILIFL